MRIQIYETGETVENARVTAAESFGRIGRRQPAAAWRLAGANRRKPYESALGNGSFAIELHAAARADRSRRIGDLVAFAFSFIADSVRRLMAGPQRSINFQLSLHKE